MSLLEKALKSGGVGPRQITDEDVDLALAWVQGKVSISQVQGAYGKRSNACMYRVANSLRKAFLDGRIKIEK